MNLVHRWYCASERWKHEMTEHTLPWVLDGVDLSGPVLELGPGPGVVTEALLRYGVEDLTTLEIDPGSSEQLRRRYGSRVTVATGDASSMPLPDERFSTVVCCTMLHHVPSDETQDRILAEAHRVLVGGGLIAGSDSQTSLAFRLFHLNDVHNPVPVGGFSERLRRAGFGDVEVEPAKGRFRFRAAKR